MTISNFSFQVLDNFLKSPTLKEMFLLLKFFLAKANISGDKSDP
jgi:hypothetical protein